MGWNDILIPLAKSQARSKARPPCKKFNRLTSGMVMSPTADALATDFMDIFLSPFPPFSARIKSKDVRSRHIRSPAKSEALSSRLSTDRPSLFSKASSGVHLTSLIISAWSLSSNIRMRSAAKKILRKSQANQMLLLNRKPQSPLLRERQL